MAVWFWRGRCHLCVFNDGNPLWNDPSILYKFECPILKNALRHLSFDGSGEGDEVWKKITMKITRTILLSTWDKNIGNNAW